MLRNLFFAGGLVALMGAAPALAEYPEKPIELIVAFAPCGGTDVAARSVALFMEKHLGNGAKIAVVNKPGAGGSSDHIGLLQLNQQAGTSFKQAFFGSTAPVRQALLGGHIPAATMNLSEALELQRSGDFHILGIMAEDRNPAIPDVPTFKEKGADVVVTTSRGLAAPAGVDPAIIEKLQTALQAALADPDYAENAKKADIPVAYLNATEYRGLIDQIVGNLEATWKQTPWR